MSVQSFCKNETQKHLRAYEEVEMIAVENREELMIVNLRLIFFVKVLENCLCRKEKENTQKVI